VTDSNGAVLERRDYTPFGEELLASGCNQPVGSLQRSPRCDVAGYLNDANVRLKFTSKAHDTETTLDYFGARYFSGAHGRFTSPDKPFADQHIGDPQSWNLYAYVRNNPLRLVDDTGERRKGEATLSAHGRCANNLDMAPCRDS